jgi:parvulin-like peptidyl-prolyl isomerase
MGSERGVFGRLMREPLFHFLLIGIMVFGVYRFAGPLEPGNDRPVIEVTTAQEERLAGQFETVWRRPPTSVDLEGLVEDHVREEIYYREGLALGLDRDDTVIRRRLRQKMEFLGDAGAGGLVPEEAELRAYLEAHVERFAAPAKVTFRQVLLDGEDPREVLARLAAGADPAEVGRGALLPTFLDASTQAAVDGTFGAGFFETVAALPSGVWSGPVRSAFGAHLVELLTLEPATAPQFEVVRRAVEEDWRRAKAEELREAQYQSLRAQYEVILPSERSP